MARPSAVIAALLLAASPTMAGAQPTRVTFEQALGLAEQLPELVVMRSVAAAERTLALPLPWQPLTLSFTPQLRLRPRASRGPEGGIAVQQSVPLADINGARRQVLERQADARTTRAAAAHLEARLAIARAWIAAWVAREQRVVAEREYELARAIVDVTERGLAAGVFTAPELADAKAFLAEASVRRIDADGEITHTGFVLAREMVKTGEVHADGTLPDAPLPPVDITGELVARAQRMPAVIARRLATRVALARAAEEKASRGPQVIVGAEVFRDEPGGVVGGVTLGLTLPHDRGQREAREAQLEARVAEAEATQLVARAVNHLEDALHEVTHTGEVLRELRDQLVPAADEAARRRQRALEIGESTIVELLAARRTALLARARLTDAQAAHAWARIQAWLLLEASRVGDQS